VERREWYRGNANAVDMHGVCKRVCAPLARRQCPQTGPFTDRRRRRATHSIEWASIARRRRSDVPRDARVDTFGLGSGIRAVDTSNR